MACGGGISNQIIFKANQKDIIARLESQKKHKINLEIINKFNASSIIFCLFQFESSLETRSNNDKILD